MYCFINDVNYFVYGILKNVSNGVFNLSKILGYSAYFNENDEKYIYKKCQ